MIKMNKLRYKGGFAYADWVLIRQEIALSCGQNQNNIFAQQPGIAGIAYAMRLFPGCFPTKKHFWILLPCLSYIKRKGDMLSDQALNLRNHFLFR